MSATESPWHKVSETPPPMDAVVLFSWGVPDSCQAGYRHSYEDSTDYYLDGDLVFDDPVWWMHIPALPGATP